MSLFQRGGRVLASLLIAVMVMVTTTACGTDTIEKPQANLPQTVNQRASYGQLERGNSATGQNFGNWVVETSHGLIKDAYVRDNNKLGVVITPQVRPSEAKDLAKALAQGFRKNFPNQDLTVLMYAPDKQLILTALYDKQTKQVELQQAG
jgi:hypothetical protein